MNIFKNKKKVNISERDPTFKVKYLGNVQTAMMKGEGCVDRPIGVLWQNYVRSGGSVGIDMALTVCASGMKAYTSEQGLTEYRAHRISYCIAHPSYPRLFVWVYRHEGKKLKVELRCHAVFCKVESVAKLIAVHLHDKLEAALQEFMREKNRRQNSRLTMQRTATLQKKLYGSSGAPDNSPTGGGVQGVLTRQKYLSTAQNFKPPVERSSTAPKLGAITEDIGGEIEEGLGEEEEVELEDESGRTSSDASDSPTLNREEVSEEIDTRPRPTYLNDRACDSPTDSLKSFDNDGTTSQHNGNNALVNGLIHLEMGNDIDELKSDTQVQNELQHDSDDNSSESGFSEQDGREATSSTDGGSNGGACSPSRTANQAHAWREYDHELRSVSRRSSSGSSDTIVNEYHRVNRTSTQM